MSSQIRTAVVGVGYLGRFHAQKHKLLAGVNFVGVCDANPLRAKEVATELTVPTFSSPKDLIGKVDAVTVSCDTKAHFEVAKLLLENGIHVLVEKPITPSSEEAESLVELAERKGLVLQVGHIERFNPAYLASVDRIREPHYIEMHRMAPYKARSLNIHVVFDLMIHDLDLASDMIQSHVVDVESVGQKFATEETDFCHARILYQSGAVANITVSRVAPWTRRQFLAYQDDQQVFVDLGQHQVTVVKKTVTNGSLDLESLPIEKSDAMLAETKSFFDCIANKQAPVVSGLDGLEAVRLAEKVIGIIK